MSSSYLQALKEEVLRETGFRTSEKLGSFKILLGKEEIHFIYVFNKLALKFLDILEFDVENHFETKTEASGLYFLKV